MPTALVTGVTGQDGSYLAEFLLEKGYQVVGLVRRTSTISYERLRHIQSHLILEQGDLLDQSSLDDLIRQYQPREVYNLAAQSFVPASWGQPVITGEVAGLGVTRLLEAIRHHCPTARFYQASSSEIFGKPLSAPQNEATPFRPRTPYGVSKLYGYWIAVNYRDQYNLFAASGILYNHESPRRGLEFVTRKIANGVARIKMGLDRELRLGDLDARRDWGYAGDYVRAMWLMLQQDVPQDFVIGSGAVHSVRQFCEAAFGSVGLDYRQYVVVDPRFVRPPEAVQLISDPARANTILDWHPEVSFERLAQLMVEADLHELSQGAANLPRE